MSQHGRDPPFPTESQKRATPPTLLERMRSLFGLQAASIRDDIEDAIEESDTDVFTPQERSLLRSVLGLHEIRVEDIMVPRADMIAIALDDSLGKVLALFREAGHSRLPVHGETLDDPKGMVHIRDFVHYITEPAVTGTQGEGPAGTIHLDMAQTLEASGVMRSVLFVPPSMQALDLLVRMQATRTHMALVIDEFGGTDGLVTIEDIVEIIVGDIEDEHDEDDSPKIESHPDGSFTADARASLEDVSAAVGLSIASALEGEDVDTLGGLVTSLAGHVPAQGELIPGHADVDFEILDADPRRVKAVRLRPKPAVPSEPAGPTDDPIAPMQAAAARND